MRGATITFKIVCETEAIIVEPPGEPTARNGWPSLSTGVGVMLERGRLPGSAWLTPPGTASKSVSSLFSMKP